MHWIYVYIGYMYTLYVCLHCIYVCWYTVLVAFVECVIHWIYEHVHVWRDSCVCVGLHVHVCDLVCMSEVWRMHAWCIHVCAVTHAGV